MKKITEFLETLFSTANQRIKSPFFGSFIFSWIIINWKPIFYFLFSDDKISLKIDKIETSYEFFQNSILYPLLLSFIYVVVFPYINQLIHWLTIKAESSKRVEYHKLKIEQIESSQELAEKEKTLEDIRSGNRDISQLNKKNNLLETENSKFKEIIINKDEIISDKTQQINILNTEKQNGSISLNELEKAVKNFESISNKTTGYVEFSEQNIFNFFPSIYNSLKNGDKTLDAFDYSIIKKFIEFDIIEKKLNGIYELTQKGEAFWEISNK